MSTIPVSLFLERLEQSNLLDEEALLTIRRDIHRVASAIRTEPLGRRLINQGLLTPWHVEMLKSGRFAFYLGKYKLLDLLGHGGMGVVFKAVHASLGRIVAIKVLSKERMTNQSVIARFHREIQAAASLNNPHVVVAYDADCVGDTHFLVMEYVDGTDLATIIEREGSLPIEEACEYIRQAALGLQHAHERGMVHRDIKPSNLIVARRGQTEPLVKILDMGLARFVSEGAERHLWNASEGAEGSSLTLIGQVMGTPDYMSPEQAGNTSAVDIRSDIYSLGCTLFLMLTGRFAFRGETPMAKVLARATSDAPPPSAFQPHVPPALDAVVSKMLAREPDHRFRTPADVARALEPFSIFLPQGDSPAARRQAAMPTAHDASDSDTDPGTDAPPLQREVKTIDRVPRTGATGGLSARVRVPISTGGQAASATPRADAEKSAPQPEKAGQSRAAHAGAAAGGSQDGSGLSPADPRLEEFLANLSTEAEAAPVAQFGRHGKRNRRRDGISARRRKRRSSGRRRRRY